MLTWKEEIFLVIGVLVIITAGVFIEPIGYFLMLYAAVVLMFKAIEKRKR